jgi:hypothetical protein
MLQRAALHSCKMQYIHETELHSPKLTACRPRAHSIRAFVLGNIRRTRRLKSEEVWGHGDKTPPVMSLNTAVSAVPSFRDQSFRLRNLLSLVGQRTGLDVEVTDRGVSASL